MANGEFLAPYTVWTLTEMIKKMNRVNRGRYQRLALLTLCAGVAFSACAVPIDEEDPLGEDVGDVSQASKTAPAVMPPVMPPEKPCPAEPACDPSRDVDLRPSLLITRADPGGSTILDTHFPLTATLQQLITRGKASQTPDNLFQRLWDTQNEEANGAFGEPFQPHCDDKGSTINGFPIDCPRPEGNLTAENASSFVPVALFNRFDLAANDGSHCGEYRIIYAQNSGPFGRNFIIFEGQLPNPNPACGVNACRPVAEHWANLSGLSDPVALGEELRSFYFDGLPGFGPVIKPANYGMGSKGGVYGRSGGQIRTNQFGGFQKWQLGEFQLGRRCVADEVKPVPGPITQKDTSPVEQMAPIAVKKTCTLIARPVTVKDNPFGELFDAANPDPRAASFQASFVDDAAGTSAVERLAASSLMGIGLGTADTFNGGQSTSQPFGGDPDNYVNQLNASGGQNAFVQAIDAELDDIFNGAATLTAENIAARAMTQSCAGCHQLSNGADLGDGLNWPGSGGFVHVQESGGVSNALASVFLPHREQVLETYLQSCPPPAPAPGASASAEKAVGDNGGSGTLGGSSTH